MTIDTDTPKLTCTKCGLKLRSDNRSGLCKVCKHQRPLAPLTACTAEPRRFTVPRQAALPLVSHAAPDLPPVGALPNAYLLDAVEELIRRRNELVAATRRLGLSDAAA